MAVFVNMSNYRLGHCQVFSNHFESVCKAAFVFMTLQLRWQVFIPEPFSVFVPEVDSQTVYLNVGFSMRPCYVLG